MLSGNGGRLLSCGSDHRPSGHVIGFAQQTTGTLMDGGNGGIFKRIGFNAGQSQMVSQVSMHSLQIDALQMASGDNPGS